MLLPLESLCYPESMAASTADCSFRIELVVSGLASLKHIKEAAEGMRQLEPCEGMPVGS